MLMTNVIIQLGRQKKVATLKRAKASSWVPIMFNGQTLRCLKKTTLQSSIEATNANKGIRPAGKKKKTGIVTNKKKVLRIFNVSRFCT